MAKVNDFGWSKTSSSKVSDTEMTSRIQKKAKEIWQKKGCAAGRDLENWLEAERWVKSGKS